MTDLISQIAADLQKQIDEFRPEWEVRDVCVVVDAGDGIARVKGLADVRSQELVQFANGVIGIAFNLEHDNVGVIIMGEYSGVEEGMTVRSTGRIASVPVGDGLVGRVVNALGQPIDGKGPVKFDQYRPIERIALRYCSPGCDTPVQTGLKAIDSMIPIGRGQRELTSATAKPARQRLLLIRSLTRRARILSVSTWQSGRRRLRCTYCGASRALWRNGLYYRGGSGGG